MIILFFPSHREFKEDEKQTIMHIPPSMESDQFKEICAFAEKEGLSMEIEEVIVQILLEDMGNHLNTYMEPAFTVIV